MKAGRILIVEDDPIWQELLQDPLQDEYDLTVASNKTEAESVLRAAKTSGAPFDVVTVDIGLTPNALSLDGEDILSLVDRYHPHSKCIVISGDDRVGTTRLRNYFKKFNVFDYLSKADFDLDRFKQIVAEAIYFHGYRLLEELGRGGMGVVYKALDPKHNNRFVALKVLHQTTGFMAEVMDQRRLARFRHEVETMRRLRHPHIVAVYDYMVVDEVEGPAFFVMEFLDGATLETKLSAEKRLPQGQVLAIGLQLCRALAYAHDQGIIHRDIKPSNVILLKDDRIKITDFGIAKIMNTSTLLTTTEEIIGTLDYMPPEQIFRAKGVDQRVDIYAVGAILYELLSGRRPYGDPMEKLYHNPKPLSENNFDLPEDLAGVLLKALARNADDRYQSAEQMAEALLVISNR